MAFLQSRDGCEAFSKATIINATNFGGSITSQNEATDAEHKNRKLTVLVTSYVIFARAHSYGAIKN